MKKILTAVALTLTLALGACGGGEAEPTPVESTSTPAPTQEPTQTPESSFLDEVYEGTSYRGSAEDVLDLGNSLCDLTDEIGVRGTFYTLADNVVELGSTEAEAGDFGFIYATAVVYLCPEYTEDVKEFLNSQEHGDSA